ncbi:MAG: hypothetical protein ACFCUR_11065 [Rhodomicrobiaceae bacterium]
MSKTFRNFWSELSRIGVRAALPVVICTGLAACGVSQLTDPLQGGLFGGGEDDSAPQAQAAGDAPAPSNLAAIADADQAQNANLVTGSTGKLSCPKIDIAAGGRTVTFHAPGTTPDTLSVMHRGEITRTARECGKSAGGIAIKYGFSGTVLLGPKGKPGSITLPAKVTVLGASGPIKTENVRVVVNVPAGSTAGTFSEVREIELPVAPGARYKLDVGFDQQGAG